MGLIPPDRVQQIVICDETELCLRLERRLGEGRIRYAPAARVHHFVPVARISWRALVRSISLRQ